MAQRRNSKSQAKKDVKLVPAHSKNGRPSESGDAPSGSGPGPGPQSWFTLVLVLAVVGLWSSMAVVYFDVVDYDSVLARAKEFRLNFTHVLQGKLSAYDSDGDGDFDLEDAKVLLGLNKDGGGDGDGVGGGGGENAASLEEVISVLSDEGSDWLFGFFSFLFDVVSAPAEKTRGKDDATEKKKEEEEESLPGDKEPIRGEQGDQSERRGRGLMDQ